MINCDFAIITSASEANSLSLSLEVSIPYQSLAYRSLGHWQDPEPRCHHLHLFPIFAPHTRPQTALKTYWISQSNTESNTACTPTSLSGWSAGTGTECTWSCAFPDGSGSGRARRIRWQYLWTRFGPGLAARNPYQWSVWLPGRPESDNRHEVNALWICFDRSRPASAVGRSAFGFAHSSCNWSYWRNYSNSSSFIYLRSISV